MSEFAAAYSGRRVLITGHTGFKGSWLALWLDKLGAKLAGFSLDPNTEPNHWNQLSLSIEEARGDIRDAARVARFVAEFEPEIVFHLAAQPLVRLSYQQPVDTWSTNVMGTANVLEACRAVRGLRAIVVVTTDKCYENQDWHWGYRETDRLGGNDPYSASKAATELVAASYRSAFFQGTEAPLLATARAGNVVGGGDWSLDRLIPDAARAMRSGSTLSIRYPNATRPWQHVLDSLRGYLLLGERLLAGERLFASAWNFGPEEPVPRSVSDVLQGMKVHWPELRWHAQAGNHPHEAAQLTLDSARARHLLRWTSRWSFERTIGATADWYRRFLSNGEIASREQLEAYLRDSPLVHGAV